MIERKSGKIHCRKPLCKRVLPSMKLFSLSTRPRESQDPLLDALEAFPCFSLGCSNGFMMLVVPCKWTQHHVLKRAWDVLLMMLLHVDGMSMIKKIDHFGCCLGPFAYSQWQCYLPSDEAFMHGEAHKASDALLQTT